MPSSLNGTGVTFNDGSTLQSGNIPSANLGSGTANSSTFLRGDRTFAAPPSVAPTTAQVLAATAGATAGAVGTYAVAINAVNANLASNATIAGSSLRIDRAPIAGVGFQRIDTRDSTYQGGGTALSGTWRKMGSHAVYGTSSDQYGATIRWYGDALWLRIS